MADVLDPTQLNPVASPDEPIVMPKPTVNPPLVTGPSQYSGLPKDIATVLEAAKPNKTFGQRMLGADLPKYAFQLGAGMTEAATLGVVDPKQDPITTGEALIRGFGHLYGSMFNPVGPAVAVASKFKKSTTIAGALANVAAAEIETKGDASAGRLLLEGTFGALFGRFYGRSVAARAAVRKPTGEINLSLPEEAPFVGPRAGTSVGQPQLLLPSPGRSETDFFASFANESEASSTLRAASRTLRGTSELPDYVPPIPRRFDRLGANAEFPPNAVVGEGLFKELGIKAKAGSTKTLQGEKASDAMRKMRFHPDPTVRETAKMIETFEKNADDIQPTNMTELARKVQSTDGEIPDVPNSLAVNLWEDPYTIERLPRSQLKTGITELSRFRSPEYVLADVQKNTRGRIPAYQWFWESAQGRDDARKAIGREGVVARDYLKGTSGGTDKALKPLMHTRDFNERAALAATYDLSPADVAKADKAWAQLEPMWNRNFPDHSFEKYMTETLPALKRNNPQELALLKFDPAVDEVTKWAANHEMSFQETGLTRFVASHIRALSMKEHFDPHYKMLEKISRDPTYPTELRNYVGDWARKARGTSSLFIQKWNPVYRRMFQRLGVDPGDADLRDVVDNYVSLTHAGLVGFRPGPLIRNMFGVVQTGNRIGMPYLWQGMKKAMTSEGRMASREAGMIDEAAHEVEALRELAAPGRFTQAVRKVTNAGLKPYGSIDDYNRSALFLGMRDRFLDAAKSAKGDREALLTKSGLYHFHEAIRDHVLEPWAKGDVKRAADLAGVHAAQATQWVYRNEYRPLVMDNNLGRAFFQFGIWPVNYLEYVRQMLPGGVQMPRMERFKWMRDFAITNLSIIGAMTAAGATVGLGPEAMRSTAGWTGLGPLAYAGGPAVDMAMALPQLAKDFQDMSLGGVANDAAFNRVKSNLVNMVPGIGLQRDIARAKGPLGAELSKVVPTIPLSESQSVLPSQSTEEELFRLFTGVAAR